MIVIGCAFTNTNGYCGITLDKGGSAYEYHIMKYNSQTVDTFTSVKRSTDLSNPHRTVCSFHSDLYCASSDVSDSNQQLMKFDSSLSLLNSYELQESRKIFQFEYLAGDFNCVVMVTNKEILKLSSTDFSITAGMNLPD